MWLVDNNVPRQVTVLLRDLGHDVLEVRAVLAANAPDAAIARSPRNWSAYVPDLPGCIATGRTRDEVEIRIREAIRMHIEGMRDAGLPIPEPVTETGAVEVSR